jgi:hypothetical protein
MKEFFEKPIFDPKNPLWLEILRYLVIFGTSLLLFGGIIFAFVIAFRSYIFFGAIVVFLFFSIASIVVATVYYILGMVSLNLLYNVQQIRVNTSRNR